MNKKKSSKWNTAIRSISRIDRAIARWYKVSRKVSIMLIINSMNRSGQKRWRMRKLLIWRGHFIYKVELKTENKHLSSVLWEGNPFKTSTIVKHWKKGRERRSRSKKCWESVKKDIDFTRHCQAETPALKKTNFLCHAVYQTALWKIPKSRLFIPE